MNLSQSKGCLLPYSGEQSFESLVPPSQALMVDDVSSPESPEQLALSAHSDARRLVRLVQCRKCSKPFTAPVTLPCGHTLCRTCLPPLQPRANISYPNTPDRLTGIQCPVHSCEIEHAAADCNVDVTLTNIMELIREEVSKFSNETADSAIDMEEIIAFDQELDLDEKEKLNRKGSELTLHGGRLCATFVMAELGKLHFSSEIEYTQHAPTEYVAQQLDMVLLERLREVAYKEMDCLVCYSMMLDPTTTGCGHTFCRRCLTRVLDHGCICPMCRRNLDLPSTLRDRSSNNALVGLLNSLCPDTVAARAAAVSLEEQPGNSDLSTPLFVCTLALPTMPTFLHIFEPRYRLMMRRCLEGDRCFGMLMYNRDASPQGELGATTFLEYGTLLEIVNYELLRDGRSYVETRGISRFKVRDHGLLDGYIVGRIERVDDVPLAEEGLREQQESADARLQAQIFQQQNPDTPLPYELTADLLSTQDLLDNCLTFVNAMKESSAPWLSSRIVQAYGEPPEDPALFPYWFACVLPIVEEEKYRLLETTRVRERLKIVYGWIGKIRGQRWPSGSVCSIL